MAALDFPSSPTIGQIYTANGGSWKWDGVAWVSQGTSETWVRPSEWLPMPEVSPTEDKFAGLIAVYDTDANYVELKVDGASAAEYTVDWGDGVEEDYDYGDVATHQYNYADADLTSTTYGYKQAMVVVTPKGSEPWTYFSLQEGAIPGSITEAPVNWLDIVFSGPSVTTLKFAPEEM